ncbi:MAG: YqaJ viral recombinase family protein [Hydrogenovibrio sp.]|uniref:YqaJ viral recombinase family nuclease n=1 Tax=Hydrogenovibrio sp. TaxID=2065821 RepID=UPI0028701716|nr:YqaJ viral recombinase family protein [Hydrogenovibrio sp.]MDR9499948.1 YqaJ viral recombinase family protein [Hydrogenovibrio sp.]
MASAQLQALQPSQSQAQAQPQLKVLKDTNPSQNAQRKFGAAQRMIATNDLDQNLWLKYRNLGIGASDAAAACGLSPFKSQLELWMEKTGRIEPAQPSDTEDSPLLWGSVLEPIVAEHYAKRTQSKVRRVNAILQHSKCQWMIANLDREVQGGEVSILECKTAGVHSAKHWANGVPEYIQLQVQHQLAVTGFEAADVAVLIGGQQLQIHRVRRDEELIANLIQLEQTFWQRVKSDTPPAADASASSDRALRQLYPQDNHELIDLSEDRPLNQAYERLLSLRGEIKALTKEEAAIKHQLQQAMGDASIARLKAGRVSWKRSKPATAFDHKAFQEEHPELFGDYQIPKMGTRRFLVQPD